MIGRFLPKSTIAKRRAAGPRRGPHASRPSISPHRRMAYLLRSELRARLRRDLRSHRYKTRFDFFSLTHTRSLLALLRGRPRRPSGAPPWHRHDVSGASPHKGYRFSEGRRTAAIEGGRDSWVQGGGVPVRQKRARWWVELRHRRRPQCDGLGQSEEESVS